MLGPETRVRRYSVPEQPEPFRLKRGPTLTLGRGREADEKPVCASPQELCLLFSLQAFVRHVGCGRPLTHIHIYLFRLPEARS